MLSLVYHAEASDDEAFAFPLPFMTEAVASSVSKSQKRIFPALAEQPDRSVSAIAIVIVMILFLMSYLSKKLRSFVWLDTNPFVCLRFVSLLFSIISKDLALVDFVGAYVYEYGRRVLDSDRFWVSIIRALSCRLTSG